MEHFAAACPLVVDAQGEVDVCEVAPIIGNGDVLDIRVRQSVADKVIGAVIPANINAVVILRFLLFLPAASDETVCVCKNGWSLSFSLVVLLSSS